MCPVLRTASFDPEPVTPCSTGQSHLRLVCRWLTYRSSDNDIDTSEDEAQSPNAKTHDITPHRPDTQPATLRATLDAQVYLERR